MTESAFPKKRVLITGAGGRIGSHLARTLNDIYTLRLLSLNPLPPDLQAYDAMLLDIRETDRLTETCRGIDAIIHLAGDPSTRATWESVLQNNIIGTYSVYEAARRAGVQRVVFASTNHVMGMYDRDHEWPVYSKEPVRPDSLYGVSKAFGENIARFYFDRYGVCSICLRIGWFLEKPRDEIGIWMWLSPRDATQIVRCAVESSIPFGIFYATSNNTRRHWDITDTMELLGYFPQDNSETYASEILGENA
jgi:nucleoside-diphosphate-sugar epimerase